VRGVGRASKTTESHITHMHLIQYDHIKTFALKKNMMFEKILVAIAAGGVFIFSCFYPETAGRLFLSIWKVWFGFVDHFVIPILALCFIATGRTIWRVFSFPDEKPNVYRWVFLLIFIAIAIAVFQSISAPSAFEE